MRIVSLLPSATEMVCGLGLRDALVGVTHECDYPAGVETLPKVTHSHLPANATSREIDDQVSAQLTVEPSLYALDVELLRTLQPDLIITQTVCDVCAVSEHQVAAAIRELSPAPEVVHLSPACLHDVLGCIEQLGRITGTEEAAREYLNGLRERIDRVTQRSSSLPDPMEVVVLEWIDPPFSAGHWTPELVALAGGRECLGQAGQKSQTLSWETVRLADPEAMMLACCGFSVQRAWQDLPILERMPGWGSLKCVREKRVYVVDGSAYFNRPGPRLVDSLELLAHLLHPGSHPEPTWLAAAPTAFREVFPS